MLRSGVPLLESLIHVGNAAGNAVVQAMIDALIAQTAAIEGVVEALGIGPLAFERSQALDNPEAVFQ
jgi:putative iron-regulated protein